jgi:hypothetical protein
MSALLDPGPAAVEALLLTNGAGLPGSGIITSSTM